MVSNFELYVGDIQSGKTNFLMNKLLETEFPTILLLKPENEQYYQWINRWDNLEKSDKNKLEFIPNMEIKGKRFAIGCYLLKNIT